jgi:1-acyl-sn-glycerol-3-phosphate acyltransferase
VSTARALRRAARVVGHAVAGLAQIVFRFPRLPQAQRDLRVQAWASALVQLLGVQLRIRGPVPVQGPLLLVANHISWLDIVVLHAAHHCRFVSKADVRRWPLVGILATGAGTLYIQRESRRDALRVVHHMAKALKDGDILAVFPEGTTGDGHDLLPFHANLIQAAIAADAPVQPVALRYVDPATGDNSQAMSYIGDETLIGSLWRTLSAQAVLADVVFGAPQTAEGRERRAWAGDLREAIRELRASDPCGPLRKAPAAD